MLEKSLPPRRRQTQTGHSAVASKSTSGMERRQQQAASPSSLLPQFPTHSTASTSISHSTNSGNGGNVDQVLFDNLVEVVPLIETLMGQRANSSFSRRASVIYTPAPSRPNKNVESKGSENSLKKKRDRGVSLTSKDASKDGRDGDIDDSSFPSKPVPIECGQKNEELNMLKEELDELQRKLAEKDEAVKSVESSVNDLKHQVQQKDTLIRSTQSQLNDAKINLADKQAKLEKLQWEAKEANNHAMRLQEKLNSVEFEVCSFMQLYQEISKTDSISSFDEESAYLHDFKQLPDIDFDEMATENAQKAYLEALAALKMNPSEESLSNAAEARMKLQALVL